MVNTNATTRPLATPESYRMTQEFFVMIAEEAGTHRFCPLPACRRKKRCGHAPMSACGNHFSANSHEGRLIRIGMPFCIAAVWDAVRDGFWQWCKDDLLKT